MLSEDWVVRYKNRLLQLERQSQHWAPAKSRVVVRENQAGDIANSLSRTESALSRTLYRGYGAERGKRRCPFPPRPLPRDQL